MNGTESPILELQDLTRVFSVSRGLFRGKQPLYAVRGVSLRIRKGDVFGLVGESGCGKSTLAMMLLGLLPVTGGRILMDGKEIAGWDRKAIARAVTRLPLPVTGNRGFEHAEVTAGGIPLAEIRLAAMESRLRPGLHLCGEICDVDGRIGGFNFQWAWSSGYVAGVSV